MNPILNRLKPNGLFLAALGFLISHSSLAQVSPRGEPEGTVNEKRLNQFGFGGFDLQGSVDWAKLHQLGNSKAEFIPQIRENIVTYVEFDPDNPFANPNNYHSPEAEAMPFQNSGPSYQEMADTDYNGRHAPAPIHARSLGYFGFRAGFGYVGKGGTTAGLHLNLNYLELPVQVLYHYAIGPGRAFIGLGPYLAYGIGGGSGDEALYGANEGGFKRLDYGFAGTLGYRLKMGLFLALGYDFGLANITYANQDVTTRTRDFSVNVGYDIGRFFRKKSK